jgi:hypothetical protein
MFEATKPGLAKTSRGVVRIGLPGLLGTMVLLAACSGAQRMPTNGPQTAMAVLERAAAVAYPQHVQGTARMDAYVGKERRSGNLLLFLDQPGKAQVQALSPTLDLLALMSTDGERFTSFERGGKQCLTGPACPANLARLVPIALPASELVGVLLGRPPLLASSQQTLHWDEERGLYRVQLGDPAGDHEDVYIEPQTFRYAGAVWFAGKTRVGSVQYAGRQGALPKVLRLKASRPQTDLTLEWREPDTVEPIDAETFAVPCPAGMPVVELRCEEP